MENLVIKKPKIIDIIAGTRPNFVKIAALLTKERLEQIQSKSSIKFRLIHTGQHYDPILSESFFEQLKIKRPDHFLQVGSGTQAEQTAHIMIRYEAIIMKQSPSLCLVFGDVNSTAACAIAAKKMKVPVGHIEAGIRSFDQDMPEEINRMLTDSISDFFFTTSEFANKNLRTLGVSHKNIFFVGNTMIDTLKMNLGNLKKPETIKSDIITNNKYIVLTLHRPSNVDDAQGLEEKINHIISAVRGKSVVFPVHPRTAKILKNTKYKSKNLHVIEPLAYFEFNYLVQNALAVITDSGGITEEASFLGVPCFTLRTSTERPETVEFGTNELIGEDFEKLETCMDQVNSGQWKKGKMPPLWDGETGLRILKILERFAAENEI
jgi:UDP-N-acetylglucosamine 2-epimerase (non-hydrolysing)